jgi:hypothetical protein
VYNKRQTDRHTNIEADKRGNRQAGRQTSE